MREIEIHKKDYNIVLPAVVKLENEIWHIAKPKDVVMRFEWAWLIQKGSKLYVSGFNGFFLHLVSEMLDKLTAINLRGAKIKKFEDVHKCFVPCITFLKKIGKQVGESEYFDSAIGVFFREKSARTPKSYKKKIPVPEE